MKQKTYLDQLMENSKEFAELLEKEYRKVKIAELIKIRKDISKLYQKYGIPQEMIEELEEKEKINRPLGKKQLPKSNKNWEIIPGEKLTDEFIHNLVGNFYKNKKISKDK